MTASPKVSLPPLEISYPATDGGYRSTRFEQSFVVGRQRECEVCIVHLQVSRRHLQCLPQADGWWWRDLDSRNGVFRGTRRLREGPLRGRTVLRLGTTGPVLTLTPLAASQPLSAIRHWLPVMLLSLLLIVGGFAGYQYYSVQRLSTLAVDMFYAMKTLELNVINLQAALQDSAVAEDRYHEEITVQQRQLQGLQDRYAEFMAEINQARFWLSEEDRLILQVARLFGESDANAPAQFVAEVKRYIRLWQSSNRLGSAMRRLQQQGYTETIARSLQTHGLPPQFLYLALQESNFRSEAVGPTTRYGHAKGMWQFIPATAVRYGLVLGPLHEEGIFDPADERHDFARATLAASRYLRDIYRTDAQASGLLVMASYNWGEGNIIRLLQRLPENPRERNFWNLLQHHSIPKETYDYVFYIMAATVIGENPRLFGFDFDNPLQTFN